jgi:hypothetical protein
VQLWQLSGSPARSSPGRGCLIRITAQLIDAHLWADRFDGSLEDVFNLQDRVALSVAGAIEPALQAGEMRRSAARPSAYDLYRRALGVFSLFRANLHSCRLR